MTRAEEPEYDEQTRAWILADERAEGLTCSLCGLPVSVCQAMENEDGFEAEPPIRCHAATALIRYQEKYGDDVPQSGALRWTTPRLKGSERA